MAYTSVLAQASERRTFVDVGANVGLVSLLVADKVEHAILFEPNPQRQRAKRISRLIISHWT
jgi:predicted RNA methylase